jgi:L-alanine-DL-glutamate epimerase-like enolase superfamily enzyme
MSLEANIQLIRLAFKFDAGTSRGILKERNTYILEVWDNRHPELIGRGEAGPLQGLSPDFDQVERGLGDLCKNISGCQLPDNTEEIYQLMDRLVAPELPAVRFALETALLDLASGARQVLFPGRFTAGLESIPINGLIWMGEPEFMKDQIDQKADEGYRCIKMMFGALNFEQECRVLEYVWEEFGPEIDLRVDAYGDFSTDEVDLKLE